jgi:D-sedoheptulose 7-phosphate isomerase
MSTIAKDADLFAQRYTQAGLAAMQGLDLDRVTRIVEAIWNAYQSDHHIFILGNGGSALTSSHVATDLAKGALGHRGDAPARPVRALSLTDNSSTITAWANDVGYDNIFVGQLQSLLRPDDVVVALSVSGNSRNVLNAIRYARRVGATTIGLSGCGGGALQAAVDVGVVVNSDHYGVVEDVHLQIGHMISYFFRQNIAAGRAPGRSVD